MSDGKPSLRLFVFEYRSYGDFSFVVMAETLDEAVAAILRCEDCGWTRDELLGDHFDRMQLGPLEVAAFGN